MTEILEPNVKLPHPDRQVDNLHHLERIAAAMKPDPREYEYTGVVNDLGQMSGKCACGHPIRYEFIVANKAGNQVVIGSVCIDSSIPWLIANGADRLAEQLRKALEENEEAKKEALRQLRDAKNSAEVQVLEAYYAGLKDWHKRAREQYAAQHGQTRTRWDDTTYTVAWYPDFLYRPLPAIKAQSTPGRTAASIRTKIATLYLKAMESGIDFPTLPDDKKLRDKVRKELDTQLRYVNDRVARYEKHDRYAEMLSSARAAQLILARRIQKFEEQNA